MTESIFQNRLCNYRGTADALDAKDAEIKRLRKALADITDTDKYREGVVTDIAKKALTGENIKRLK